MLEGNKTGSGPDRESLSVKVFVSQQQKLTPI